MSRHRRCGLWDGWEDAEATPWRVAMRPFVERELRRIGEGFVNEHNMTGVIQLMEQKLRGEGGDRPSPGDPRWKKHYVAEVALEDWIEDEAAARLPAARPGIQSMAHPDHVILYRTARDPREGVSVLQAVDRGVTGHGFRPSSHHLKKTTEQKSAAATRRGKVPVYTSPYPSVAGLYRSWHAPLPITFAMEVPRSAIIYISGRAHPSQGYAYSVWFVDTEIIVDAAQITRLWYVPTTLVQQAIDGAAKLHHEQTVAGSMKNVWKDRDPALAKAGAEAIADLRSPPTTLGRLFLETPAPTTAGPLRFGDRILLWTGEITKAQGWRPIDPGGDFWWQRMGATAWIEVESRCRDTLDRDFGGVVSYMNVPDILIARILPSKARITAGDREAVRRQGLPLVTAILHAGLQAYEASLRLREGEHDVEWAARIRERITQIHDRIKTITST